MNVLILILILAVLFGGFGAPAVGYGTYGVVPTGGAGIVVLLLVLLLIFGW